MGGHGIDTLSIADIEETAGKLIEVYKENPRGLQLWMSIAEHLKDARRYQFLKEHLLPYPIPHGELIITPEQFDRWIDGERKS